MVPLVRVILHHPVVHWLLVSLGTQRDRVDPECLHLLETLQGLLVLAVLVIRVFLDYLLVQLPRPVLYLQPDHSPLLLQGSLSHQMSQAILPFLALQNFPFVLVLR